MEDDRHFFLLRGIKNILRCDQAIVVTGIANYVVSQHRSLRLLAALIERTRWTPIPAVVALVGGLRSLLAVRSGGHRTGGVWIARLGNERQAILDLTTVCSDLSWTELKFASLPNVEALSTFARNLNPRRILRIARLLHRRYEFFKVLRVVELICYYSRYLEIFQNGQFKLAAMSSHSNPHGIAFNLAARKCGVPVVLTTHGMPIRPVARLNYDLGLVHCEAARQIYFEEGSRIERVYVHGRRQNHFPMPTGPLPKRLSVGIFLCKDVNEDRLRAVIDRLLDHPRVSRIMVRPHPKNLWMGLDAWIASRKDRRVSRTSGVSVFSDVAKSDIVLAGNSSVLVDAVTAGRPSGFVPGLDHGFPDLHAFAARGLIYQIDDHLDFDPDAMLDFYQRPDWLSVLRLFANVDEDEASVAEIFSADMRELALGNCEQGYRTCEKRRAAGNR